MATSQKSVPFGTTNTTDDTILVQFTDIAGGANDTHTFDVPFETRPDVLSVFTDGTPAGLSANWSETVVTFFKDGAGASAIGYVMVRGRLKSTSDKLP